MKPGKGVGLRFSASCLGTGVMQQPLNRLEMEVLLEDIIEKINFCSNEAFWGCRF